MKVRSMFKKVSPVEDKILTVTLGARAPDSRSLGTVEHPELDR